MSGPRMGNVGQMNGSRRPNISRMNYHDSRQSSSYQDHRQSYQDHRQSSHDNRQHDLRQHDHRPHENRQHDARSSPYHPVPQPTVHTQHDELIKYLYEAWSKVELDKGSNNVLYFQEHENPELLKDFRPFDLEAYWGRRVVHQSHHQHQS